MSNRFALRAMTRRDHDLLDASASEIDLSTRDGYLDFLLWHAGVVPALERHLDHNRFSEMLADWPERCRRHALLADLEVLGARPLPLDQTLGTSAATDPGNSPAALWGAAYVLEGSRLGAKILLGRIPPHLRNNAARYLTHGHDEGLWSSFSRALDANVFTKADLRDAGAAARAVFALFTAALPRPAQSPPMHKTG